MVGAGTSFVDTSPTIVATMDREIYIAQSNEETIVTDFVLYYSVVPYTIDEEGNIEEGTPSKPVTEEDSRLSCSGPFDSPYMIGNFPVGVCGGMKYGLPSNKYTKQITQVIREQAIYLLQRDGQWVWWFKRLIAANAAPMWTWIITSVLMVTNALYVMVQNIVGGFYKPLLIKMVIVYGQKKMVMEDMGIRAIRESKSWTIWQPKISVRDIFVMANGKRVRLLE